MDKEISFQDLLTKLSEIEACNFPLRPIKTIIEDTECFDIFSVILDQEPPIVHVINLKRISGGFITLRDLLGLFLPNTLIFEVLFLEAKCYLRPKLVI
ncbi:MAG: hypothetical protein H7647_03405 [Candidatus Heimdallarchaeota archaeon]|nr:hypothetical protein [Candidatus Heimdallarchaeota archaeon]MCK4253474.1 hypothetical protein [Candidatus Heimdallarchaeota archaeon]